MQLLDLRFMVPAGTLGAVREHRAKPVQRLTLPRAHLIRMHLVSGRDLLDRPVAPQRLQPREAPRNAGTRTEGSNPARKMSENEDLMAEGEEPGSNLLHCEINGLGNT